MDYVYYRAGIRLAVFRIEGGEVRVRALDEETMELKRETLFSWPAPPFGELIDRNLQEALERLSSGGVPENYVSAGSFTAEILGRTRTVERYIPKEGMLPLDLLVCEGETIACIDNERNYLGILVREGFEDATPQKDMAELPEPVFGSRFAGTYMVPMRDGARLATDVYLPCGAAGGQRFPTILIRTCYGRKDGARLYPGFVHYGYALAIQDTRGRGDSEGAWQPIINERDDGDDTLNWIAGQDFSDGGVGMIGASYLSIVQWQAAASGNPHLKAMISMVTGGVPLFDFPHRSGVLNPGTMEWATAMNSRDRNAFQEVQDDWNEILKHRPIREIPRVATGEDNPFWNEWLDHEYYDGYWHRANFLAFQHKIDIPTLYVSGWYDDVSPGTVQTWDMNRRNGRKDQQIIIGPWFHKFNSRREINGNRYGPDSIRTDLFPIYLRWYEHFLKGADNGVEKRNACEYFVIGENAWRSSAQWPPAESEDTAIYLSSSGNANTSGGDGRLSFEAPESAGEDRYPYDPKDPAPFIVEVSENELLVPADYSGVEKRSDVLVYTTEELEEPVTIAGEPLAVIYAASDARDTDWVVRITDVFPDGTAVRMCDGIVRAKFRRSFIEPKLLLPGEIVRYEIPMTWIANRFAKGNRIRVEITSGADKSVFCNTNTGLPMADDGGCVVASQTVYHGGEHRSRVMLPILKR